MMDYFKIFVPVDPASAIEEVTFEKDFSTLPHSSYEWERIYSTFVSAGDVDGARKFMQDLSANNKSVTVGNVSQSELNRSKYLAVSAIAIITRVAINSGADELTSYEISDQFIQFLDSCNDPELITLNLFHFAEKLIQAVHDAKESNYNNLYYKRCREYINAHIGSKITVNDLASICGLTPNYLSAVFKKLSGKTVTEYILDQRIQVAQRLLLADNHNIIEISAVLGFNSQSYFISCFKKKTGETPRQWKMNHTRNTGLKLYPD